MRGRRTHEEQRRVVAIFGYPVRHSLSPAMHNAAFKALGLPWTYIPCEVRPSVLRAALDSVRAMDMPGCNLTIPLKEKALKYVDTLSDPAQLTGAVNTVVNRKGILAGYNTDGEGFVQSLKEELGFDPREKKIVIIGAGGAARGIAFAVAMKGAGFIGIVNRHEGRAKRLERDVAGAFSHIELFSGPPRDRILHGLFHRADLLVHATSVGMEGKGVLPLPLEELRENVIVSDIVYRPYMTRLLRRAQGLGLRVHPGMGMLLHQGAVSLGLWTHRRAPIDIMRKTLKKCLCP